MCKKFIYLIAVVFAFCTTAMAADIAFYVGQWNTDGWYDATQFDDVETIIAETGYLFGDIQQFDDNQFNEFGAWVDENTDDGELDIIWLNGCTPSVLYPNPNTQPDGSRAEKWLDNGNMIINVGDWFAYCTFEGGSRGSDNAGSGAANILDLASSIIAGEAHGVMNVTATGQEYLPSLNAVTSDRPVLLSAVAAPWEVAAVFAQDSAGTYADPVVIHNTETEGYLAIINQGASGNWINDRGLTCAEFINNWFNDVVGFGGNPYARCPEPKDGAMVAATWTSLYWTPGDFVASHDVYVGDNFDDVNDATRDSEVFRVNQDLGTEFYIVGFTGYAYPDGLVPGTTYYWRIDEVNDANEASPWKGKVWSFWVPPKKAYDPVPSDGSKFNDYENLTLSWTTGFGAILHTVYFGDDYDTVANATTGRGQGTTSFKPGPLEPEKTYYWRIDEFEAGGTHTGDVWSFTTAKVGGGLRAEYYHWSGDFPPANPFQVFVTSEMVDEIDWNWGDPGSPHPLVNVDDFSCRFTGEVEAGFTETYTFYMTTDDGQRLWIEGQPVIDMWVQQGMTEHSGTIDLVAGQRYSIEAWMYEHGGGAGCELRWSSPNTPKQIIPQAALSPPVKASSPSPYNGATGTKMTPILRWGPGESAVSHEVYFGTDADAVANADKSSPEYKGSKALGDESLDPGKLAWHTQYYWRIDEVNDLNPDSPWVGNLWSFTTGDFLVIDDFEDYDTGENQIWYKWHDGLGYGAIGVDPYFAGNGTGSAVGDESSPSYTEETIVHSGRKSMPLEYNNNKPGYANYSEAEMTLTYPRDWTEQDVAELSLWFRGYPASTGSFAEGPVGTFTMTGSGADIWLVNDVEADEFHFAYKMLTGAGSIIARVDSVENTNEWAKAGVMIRETLDPDSAHAFACVTPANGVAMQYRPSKGGTSVNYNQTGVAAPYWVKLERSISGLFTVSHSTNGTTWEQVTGSTPQNIPMTANVYIGLALTAHDAALTCQAVFSNVTTTGNVTGQWTSQDIGIVSNDAEQLYIAVSNSTGAPAIVVHDDPAAAQIDTWTEWVIPFSVLTDQGLTLTNVDRVALGLGDRNNPQPGGSGKMFFDDIRLYRTREAEAAE
jgi:hypothetical protein